ncbi:hypothetical protein F5884DRAFT_747007 [Xylogone sp. PMI_703]|nr:hypothetical protein F5884DRAFT_747007 [Xylogone sp. PMI_703]
MWPINLPWFVTLHAAGMAFLGLRMLFRTGPVSRQNDVSAMLGIATIGLSLGYLCTSYVPMEQNQFLHASVPVRVILAALAGLRVVFGSGLTSQGKKDLLVVLFYDGLGGLAVGWWLGRYDGRIAG